MVTILERFFLKIARDEEIKELDDWMHECLEHDQLFDLMIDENRDGSLSAIIPMLRKIANRQAGTESRAKKIMRLLFGENS
ncbi:hypothetical protein [Flavihumibacter solisilvae]|nr:hypothetical protein [Flavihumibacter solisilvae]